MFATHALAAGLAAAMLGGGKFGHTPCPPLPVHMTVQVGMPRYGDFNNLIYLVDVANLGPGRATGLVVGRSALLCATASTPLASCQRLPPVTALTADLGPGDHATLPANVPLPTEGPIVVRTTVEVMRADQTDIASTLGACQDGQHPQDACATVVTQVLP